ncbi:MAG: hypothetical protein US49_C0006G0207 [candidate division TM6 bacterium GW2011_GWF2_37_49]|nr:MAG: hypothetical protein US49_C0006G0207 [candidate division TM6 bacterium GW2011_GWF2_37_49]
MEVYDSAWDRKKGDKKDELVDSKNVPALVLLIDQLFHRPPNTAGRANFTPTVPIKALAHDDLASLIAEILALTLKSEFTEFLEKFKTLDKSKLQSYKEFSQNVKLFKGAADKALISVKLLVPALLESLEQTILTLQALVLACCADNKSSLAVFYKTLNKKCLEIKKESIFVKDGMIGLNNVLKNLKK